jgi:hypothetical protein
VIYWRTLAAGQGSGSEETILRGLSNSFAHRRAALAYGQIGEREMAAEHWRVFLQDFSDPDPDYRWMVEEARIALAGLEG